MQSVASTIKERNSRDNVDLSGKRLTTPARLASPRHGLGHGHGPGGGGARVAHLYPFLSFSI